MLKKRHQISKLLRTTLQLHLLLQPRHPLSLPPHLLLQLFQLRVVLRNHHSNLSAEQLLSAAQVVVCMHMGGSIFMKGLC